MKLALNALGNHLKNSLSPVYLIAGDEYLLRQEAVDAIRQAAMQAGYQARQKLQVSGQFNWIELQKQAQSLSLLSDKTLIELHLSTTKLGKPGSQAIADYCKQLPGDKILVIISPKLTQAQQQLAWCKAIHKIGVFLPIWAIGLHQLPAWIKARLQQWGLTADPGVVQRLAQSTEGNLLATAQAIEKLSLLYGKQHLNIEHMTHVLSDQSHFTLYQLSDACLAGQTEKAIVILYQLKAANMATTLILWSLWQVLEKLQHIKQAVETQGQSPRAVFQRLRLWDTQITLFNSALKRHTQESLQSCLIKAAQIDRINKGLEKGNLWTAYTQLILLMGATHR
jgi:DNA polymerase-3 subunit delta